MVQVILNDYLIWCYLGAYYNKTTAKAYPRVTILWGRQAKYCGTSSLFGNISWRCVLMAFWKKPTNDTHHWVNYLKSPVFFDWNVTVTVYDNDDDVVYLHNS